MRGIRPPALFELRAQWRNAVDLRHLPEGTHSLAPRPGSLVRLAFHKWSEWQDLHLQPFRLERNASSLGHTWLVPTVGLAPTLCAF